MKRTALIIDDDRKHNKHLKEIVTKAGFAVTTAESLAEAQARLGDVTPSLVFLAMDFNGEDGLFLLEHHAIQASNELFLMNATDDPPRVRYGIASGATYFSCKPLDARFIADLVGDLAAELRSATAAADELVEPCPLDQFGDLRGSSPVMRKLFRVLRKVAPADTSVLLIGESGSGKELAASTIHQFSGRAEQSFVAMNCAAVATELFESELFGHEKGSFSGASRQHSGLFERADEGTLFLDEITEMSVEHQVKLLRVLETGKFRRVGGETDLAANVRIIAATNRDPDEAIRAGLLREDLYYRIAQFPLWIPALRNRGSDIEGLAQFFLNRLNDQANTRKSFSEEAIEALSRYSFPGNVRELASIVERAFLISSGVIQASNLPPLDVDIPVDGDVVSVRVGSTVDEAEKKLILATLEATSDNKPAAAKTLGISLKTLYNRLNLYADQHRDDANCDESTGKAPGERA